MMGIHLRCRQHGHYCCGCDDVTLHRRVWHSDMFPEDGPDPGVYFPPRLSRRGPAWFSRLTIPREYAELMAEIYTALHAGSSRLAMMGARAVIDAIIRRNVGDQGTFSLGLESLVKKHLISEKQCTSLIAAIGAGHAAAHRSYRPEIEDLHIVMDIIENLIYNELSSQDIEGLKSRTPPRPKFKKV